MLIYGPDVASLKGKTTRTGAVSRVPVFAPVSLPPHIQDHYQRVVLDIDFLFVQGQPFIYTISRKRAYVPDDPTRWQPQTWYHPKGSNSAKSSSYTIIADSKSVTSIPIMNLSASVPTFPSTSKLLQRTAMFAKSDAPTAPPRSHASERAHTVYPSGASPSSSWCPCWTT